jgi:DNA helicase II / ATP-dependent DNA helicase PcrA
MFRLFMDNQVLRNADRRVRGHVHDTLALMKSGSIDALRQGLAQALAPRWMASRVMVRAQDIDQVSRHLDSLMLAASQFDDLPSLMRGLNRFEQLHQGQRPSDALVLATIEASKGLEFEHVIMPGLNRGEFGAGALHSDNRNLFYVGMTRARRALSLIHHPERPTRFLQDAGILP